MKNLVNLNSTEWCDVIFEGKNKEYGAYALRQSSGKRHLIAFGIIALFVIFVAILPAIMSKVEAANKTKTDGVNDRYSMIEVDKPLNKVEEVIQPEMPAVPEQKFVSMDKFTPPDIVDDSEMRAENELESMENLSKSRNAIGAFTVENGSDDADAIRKEVAKQNTIIGEGNGTGAGTIFRTAEIMPQFPGGEAELYKFIADNLKYPVIDQENGTQGRVTIRFVVDRTGQINSVEILRGISSSCDREAIRVVKIMPPWIPGKQNGNAVPVYFTLPIVFKLKS